MENGFIESFNGKFRDECLNENWFINVGDALEKIETWRCDYNQVRPHSALSPRKNSQNRWRRGTVEKTRARARLENAARFPISQSLDGDEKMVTSVALEKPNPEKVSLSLD